MGGGHLEHISRYLNVEQKLTNSNVPHRVHIKLGVFCTASRYYLRRTYFIFREIELFENVHNHPTKKFRGVILNTTKGDFIDFNLDAIG